MPDLPDYIIGIAGDIGAVKATQTSTNTQVMDLRAEMRAFETRLNDLHTKMALAEHVVGTKPGENSSLNKVLDAPWFPWLAMFIVIVLFLVGGKEYIFGWLFKQPITIPSPIK